MKKIEALKIREFGERIEYYSGETLNNVPFGKGISEEYAITDFASKVEKTVGKKVVNQYNKNFIIKFEGQELLKRYIGEWKSGVWHGKGELISYYFRGDFVNKDGGPKIMSRDIGNFVNGKKKGKFEGYSDMGEDPGIWSTENFK
mgnify:FL=1